MQIYQARTDGRNFCVVKEKKVKGGSTRPWRQQENEKILSLRFYVKLSESPWKRMTTISMWGPAYFQGRTVGFRKGNREQKSFRGRGPQQKQLQDVFHEITIPQVVFLWFGGVDWVCFFKRIPSHFTFWCSKFEFFHQFSGLKFHGSYLVVILAAKCHERKGMIRSNSLKARGCLEKPSLPLESWEGLHPRYTYRII